MAQGLSVASAVPYPWPFDGSVAGGQLALVRCGWQPHWLALCESPVAAQAVRQALASLARAVVGVGGLVVDVRHGVSPSAASGARAPGRPALAVRGSAGWRFEDPVDSEDGALTIEAAGVDACYGSALCHELRAAGRTHVLLGGLAAEATVDSTVRSLNDRGFECLVLTDGCAVIDPALAERALDSVTMSGGIFGAIATIGAVMAALPGD